MTEKKLRVGIIGATGLVGQRFVTLLANHPWFQITCVAASPQSAGKSYGVAVAGRWSLETPLPTEIAPLIVKDAADITAIKQEVDFVFCAVDLPKDQTLALEESYARNEIPVISNNSATRAIPDVPMLIAEMNPEHIQIIAAQRKRLGTKKGFIAVKPNCSLQSYLPALHPLREFGIKQVAVCTYQGISGAGKTFATMPEILDNVIPYIGGEEEKSEIEPLKIWGSIQGEQIVPCKNIAFSAQCLRVPVSDGHMGAVFVKFERKPDRDTVLKLWRTFQGRPQQLELPSAPKQFLTYFEEPNRPQTKLDRMIHNGMGISIGRLRDDSIFDYRFIVLSHNTLRGAAGGGVLTAELLYREGYLT